MTWQIPVLLCLLAFLAITIGFPCKYNSFFPFYKGELGKRINFPILSYDTPLSCDFLIGQPFISRCKEDDSAVGEAMLLDVVLHDKVVAVGVDADVAIFREGVFHDVAEHVVYIGVTGDAVDDMVGLFVIHPMAVVYLHICWFG